MNKILVITMGESDLLSLLLSHCNITVKSPDEDFEGEEYDSLCVLGGIEPSPIALPARLHNLAERMRSEGKPIFLEYVNAFFLTRVKSDKNMARQRMIYRDAGLFCEGVNNGDLFDGQNNDCITYSRVEEGSSPILVYKENICAHTNIETSEEEHKEGSFALWWYDRTTLISSIRLSNFHIARFSPVKRWRGIITGIVSFLAGEKLTLSFPFDICRYEKIKISSINDARPVIERGLSWIESSGTLKNGGRGGAREGFSNRISARDGVQSRNKNIRADCTNEIGGALMFDALINADEVAREYANALFDFTFSNFQIKEGSEKGMLRWSEAGWYDCYQDDVARAVIPLLLCQFFDAEIPHFEEIKATLNYLVDTTAEDGIRVPCTQIPYMTEEYKKKITGKTIAEPCAHFNAYYHASLLLAYIGCGEEKYLDYATRGLTTLMSCYPETRRETSETEEYCRLIFPLAALYGVTGKEEHYNWLIRVTEDLQKFRHPSGGYMEWDTGYKAGCSRNHNGECALLADNGDPVADLLYSNNWLPLAFSYAYFVTKEKRFYDLWCDTASFMAMAQMRSDFTHLNGAWARAFDMDMRENYGMPHDLGWGPYCIESGWSVGEILMGLQFMYIAEKKEYRRV